MNATQLKLPFEDKYELQDQCLRVILSSAEALFQRKNREYENTIVQTGVLGASVELIGISGRLKALVLHRDINDGTDSYRKSCEDDIRNALMDAIVYGAIGLMMLQTGNWDGER